MPKGHRKIDDNLCLKMFNDGYSQVKIAEHFGVTPVAVGKRLKRLAPKVRSFDKLTRRQQKFVIAKLEGKNNTQAALEASERISPANADSVGHNLSHHPKVQKAIQELLAENIPNLHRVLRLRSHVDHSDPNVSLKALDMTFKLDGSYAPEKRLNVNVGLDYRELLLHQISLIKSQMLMKRELLLLENPPAQARAVLEADLDTELKQAEEELAMWEAKNGIPEN